MKFSEYLKESNKLENLDMNELVDFISKLNLKRKPSGVNKTDHAVLKELKKTISDYKELTKKGGFIVNKEAEILEFKINGYLKNLRISKEEIEENYKEDKTTEIKTPLAKYLNESSISYDKFKKEVKNIEDFLQDLKGFHKKVLKNLVIRFVDSKRQKSVASYKEQQDVLQINIKKTGNTKEEYGSLRYVVLHELGHRYLRMFPQKWNYDGVEWITTKYSGVDSFSGEEKFAELFALSHWKNKYSEYKDKIKEFEKRIK